jgi:hypothetical protein
VNNHRKGEKIGWIGGWCGAFLWVLVMSIVLLAKGRLSPAVLGMVIVAVAAILVFTLAPWKHPTVRYRNLIAPLYVPLGISIFWCAWSFGGLHQAGIGPWSAFLILPLLLPLITTGNHRWIDRQ